MTKEKTLKALEYKKQNANSEEGCLGTFSP